MKVYVKFLSQIAKKNPEKQKLKKTEILLMSMLLFLMSQASYNLVTSAPMLIP